MAGPLRAGARKQNGVIVLDDDNQEDERPTPGRGYPVQRRTPSNGVPAYEPPRRARSRADTDEIDPVLADAFEALVRRKLRWIWRAVGGALVVAGGALLGVLGKMLDAREQTGAEKQRMQYLEREVQILRSNHDRWRDEDRPSPMWRPMTGASPLPQRIPSMQPAAPSAQKDQP